ncbi:hypothetical protein DPM19_33275 [Actinomadura craniellae]|uniref:Uncharacterized protein n=1 Tax=Actinomadura craniellae TaxID=2231787 RepID=A0A365GVJ0_9ACTN|nr:hypothetical protein [Actinomadura craniellae]RAY10837.1 hypothetical protein DPM19_33275 [Actinomadura craniellae]
MVPALAGRSSSSHDATAQRLAAEFVPIPPATVERCVADVEACVTHLGLDPTPEIIERVAREHLTGMIKSRPPSGRPVRSRGRF